MRAITVIVALCLVGSCAGQSASSYIYTDCAKGTSEQANTVQFVFEDQPGSFPWCNGCGTPSDKFWWVFDTWAIDAQKCTGADNCSPANEWIVKTTFTINEGKMFKIKVNGEIIKRDGSCTNSHGDFRAKQSGKVYLQDYGATTCKQSCSAQYKGVPAAPTKYIYRDCSGEASEVGFVFEDHPQGKPWCGGCATPANDFWWVFNNANLLREAVKGANNEWTVTPGFGLSLGSKFKIRVNGEILTYDGGCTNEHGDFLVEETGTVALNTGDAGSTCQRTCAAINTYSYFDCSKQATSVQFDFMNGRGRIVATKQSDGVEWKANAGIALTVPSSYKLYVDNAQVMSDGTCSNSNGEFTVKFSQAVYLQMPNMKTCTETCATWDPQGPPSSYSYFDCGGDATKVEFVFEDKPGTLVWGQQGGATQYWWSFEGQAQQAINVGSNEWKITPPHDLTLGKMYKIQVDGEILVHEGSCTNKHGDYRVQADGQAYHQPDNAAGCSKTCNGFVKPAGPRTDYTFVDCSNKATKVEFVFQDKPNVRRTWCGSCAQSVKDIFWWLDKYDMPAVKQSYKLSNGNAWKITPGFPLKMKSMYKIMTDGQELTYDGTCTNKHGDFFIEDDGVIYLQKPNQATCNKACTGWDAPPTPAPVAKGCDGDCLYSGATHSCIARITWVMSGAGGSRSKMDGLALVNGECIGQCQCQMSDLDHLGVQPTPAPPTSVSSDNNVANGGDGEDSGSSGGGMVVIGVVVGILVSVAALVTMYLLKSKPASNNNNNMGMASQMQMKANPTGNTGSAAVQI